MGFDREDAASPNEGQTSDEQPVTGALPRAARYSVMLTATIEHFGDVPPSRHRVRNISTGGMRIDQASTLRAGSTVIVTIGDVIENVATIVWQRDDAAGLKFANHIDVDRARAKVAIAPRLHPDKRRIVRSPD